MWKQKIFEETKSQFLLTDYEKNKDILTKASDKALEWINSSKIDTFKICPCMHVREDVGSVQALVIVYYKENE